MATVLDDEALLGIWRDGAGDGAGDFVSARDILLRRLRAVAEAAGKTVQARVDVAVHTALARSRRRYSELYAEARALDDELDRALAAMTENARRLEAARATWEAEAIREGDRADQAEAEVARLRAENETLRAACRSLASEVNFEALAGGEKAGGG